MKQKITLLIFMVLASVFTFGQNTGPKQSEKRYKNELLNKKKSERRARVLDFKMKKKTVLKSANAEKQQLDYSIGMDWNSETSQWVNSDKSEYTYDANGNLTVRIYSDWNSETSQWVNYFKHEYTYDANGNPTVEIYSLWNSETSQWENSDKSEYTYDLSYGLNDLILPNLYYFVPDYSNLIVNKPVDFIDYNYIDGSWVNVWKGTYYYSTVNVTSVSDLSKQVYSIYPNPVLDRLNFNIQHSNNTFTFELYDSQGRKLISKEIINNSQLNLEGLTKGIYLYNLIIDGEIQSGKLIKE